MQAPIASSVSFAQRPLSVRCVHKMPRAPLQRRPTCRRRASASRIVTSTLDTPTAPETDRPAPKAPKQPAPQEPIPPGPGATLEATLVVSSRKQWGFVRVEAVLVGDQGVRSRAETAVILSWPFLDWETRTRVSFKVPAGFGKVSALLLQPSTWPSITGLYVDRAEVVGLKDEEPDTIIWCHSWLGRGQPQRIFFTNTASLPPMASAHLQELRELELHRLRGDRLQGGVWQATAETRVPTDRIYQYDVYNDISCSDYKPGQPDAAGKVRPTLGKANGKGAFCYPRRLRSGRPPMPGDQDKETYSGDPYLPLDERFNDRKSFAFLTTTITSLLPWVFEDILLPWRRLREFTGFDDVSFIYRNTWQAMLKWLLRVPGAKFVFRINAMPPMPLVARGRSTLWDDDTEFARQLIAGMNPCCLRAEDDYAAWTAKSAIDNDRVGGLLDHASLEAAMDDPESCVFSIDYATLLLGTMGDSKEPIIDEINLHADETVTHGKSKHIDDKRFMYAPRCLLYQGKSGQLRPIAVELCLPGEPPRVCTPSDSPLLWRLAKTHFLSVDAAYHQLISHWLRTHACIEPFIIATMRNLSVLHPLWKALRPHFKYTLHINANARKGLISGVTDSNPASGIIERTFTAGKFAMPISAKVYEGWQFDQQALPADLLARNMLIEDPTGTVSWGGKQYRIVMGEDYPYAADGMLVWDATRKWLKAYLGEYYLSAADIAADAELQAWWKEVKAEGHPDIKHGWPKLDTVDNLADIATTIVWLASGHHAAVNFSQYSYSGYFPNYPTLSRKAIPQTSDDWDRMNQDHDKAFLESFSDKKTALQLMGVVKLLSTHDADEEYIGTRTDEATWTSRDSDRQHWQEFKKEIYGKVQAEIMRRNKEPTLKHRYLDYELLLPDLGDHAHAEHDCGPPARGVPNSISI